MVYRVQFGIPRLGQARGETLAMQTRLHVEHVDSTRGRSDDCKGATLRHRDALSGGNSLQLVTSILILTSSRAAYLDLCSIARRKCPASRLLFAPEPGASILVAPMTRNDALPAGSI